jgi:glycosyltransferase involved in cell wall biosynthesis
MVCADYGQPERVEIDGITVIRCPRTGTGLPGVRFFHPWMTGMWSALRAADADVYYQRTSAAVTGIAAMFAKAHGKRFVYAAAHDLDLARRETWRLFDRRAGWRDRQLFTIGLKLADAIVVQHAGQAADCERWFHRTPFIVPSCYEAPSGARADHRGVVLWVSTMRPWKRPDLFLDLARRLPELRFRMIGGPGSEPGARELFARLQQEAQLLPNLEFVGFVPQPLIEPHFDAARVLVNTSVTEGFPNTFLQAWSRGIPSVSFCSTGAVLDRQPVGVVVHDLDGMAFSVAQLMRDDHRWRDAGARAQRCARQTHSVDAAVRAYERVFVNASLEESRAVPRVSAA